jgi:hypothetical protein
VGAAGLAIALATLAGCHDDNNPNLPPIIPTPNSIVVADINGDGTPDLLVATTADEGYAQNPGYADVILNTPGSLGTFHTGVHYSTTGTNPSSIRGRSHGAVPTWSSPARQWCVSSSSMRPAVLMRRRCAYGGRQTGGHQRSRGRWQAISCWPTWAAVTSSCSWPIRRTRKFLAPMNLPTSLAPLGGGEDLSDGAPDIVAATFGPSGNNGS